MAKALRDLDRGSINTLRKTLSFRVAQEKHKQRPVHMRKQSVALKAKKTKSGGKRGTPNASTTADATTAATSSLVQIVSVLHNAASGFEVGAKSSRDEAIVVAMNREAASLRVAIDAVAKAAKEAGIDEEHARPRVRTCDRLRWEWIASTGRVMDGRSEMRVLLECARILEELLPLPKTMIARDEIDARLRIAKTTATSIVMALTSFADVNVLHASFALT